MYETSRYGAKEVADQLHDGLRRYLEAQYHIRDTGIIEERHALLLEAGAIGQRPFLETTPSYQLGDQYAMLSLPSPIGETLTELANWEPSIGVFPRPYIHQAEALQAFFNEGVDLIISSGTGSGKTESFLMPILGSLLYEGSTRPGSFRLPGCRALLLYPMNALVSDQVSRLRRLFGDERLRDVFLQRYGRIPRFGMYTSRTPYPGPRDSSRDRRYLDPVLRYYLNLEYPDPNLSEDVRSARTHLVEELRHRGRWPAKDLQGFFGVEGSQWRYRLQTQAGDRELFTRHEMQQQCPDILVTNYSMLEYMLLRPIERNIFQQTKDWLAHDEKNCLILVVDEAHMYRGAGGAEIALLIRRLQARLGIPRERLRCILTSASLGSGPEVEHQVKTFAVGLTGHPTANQMPFRLIQGQQEHHPKKRQGDQTEVAILTSFDLSAFFKHAEDPTGAFRAISELGHKLSWPTPPLAPVSTNSDVKEQAQRRLREYLYQHLKGFGLIECLMEETSNGAVPFKELAQRLFPTVGQDEAEHATTVLLALGTYAHNGERALLPTRVHLFFRGLPSLYACINPHCEQRRYHPGEELLLGRLYTEPRTHCTCTIHARVYELYTHRDCGAAFLHVFGRGKQASFYWYEQGGNLANLGEPLDENFLFVEKPHPNMLDKLEPIWLEMSTGRVETDPPIQQERYRQFWRPAVETDNKPKRPSKKGRQHLPQAEQNGVSPQEKKPFQVCPACTKRTGQKIMDLATKGEQPFANLVRDQFVLQPAVKEPSGQYPNAGRKVLLFSDGRQKAARLARDLPREVEFDSFRQALVLAVQRLEKLGYEATLDDRLYLAFVSVCHDFHLYFFDRQYHSQERLLQDIKRYRDFYDADLQIALQENLRESAPQQYQLALLRQLVDPYYSLYAACAAVAQPSKASLRFLDRKLSSLPDTFRREHLRAVATAWVQALLERTAFDPTISQEARREIDEYFKPVASDEAIRRIERLLSTPGSLSEAQIQMIRTQLYEVLTRPDQTHGEVYLLPSALSLILAINDTWLQCTACGLVQHGVVLNCCTYCGKDQLEERPPNHPYMTSRKGYFREPLLAVLAGNKPIHIIAEEHTAQLSQRDAGIVYATTEEYELRFQDVPLDLNKPPVDILSCTTTMEVGIDIGSLTAVGLRNVPPQRENYQQRAGRSGRRGSAVSTVLTYAQGGPHDNYYYERPESIISGKPREPKVKVDNRRLARRHIHSFLIQTFFHEQLNQLAQEEQQTLAATRIHLMSAFGLATDFFSGTGDFSLSCFKDWIQSNAVRKMAPLAEIITNWLPDELCSPVSTDEQARSAEKRAFVVEVAESFVASLEELAQLHNNKEQLRSLEEQEFSKNDKPELKGEDEQNPDLLLNVLFDEGLLPSYAFPTDLCTFYVFEQDGARIRIKERPQQGKDKALSEYAPGRLLVINKETYRVGGIYDEGANPAFPGQDIFSSPLGTHVYCPQCTYVREEPLRKSNETCPICNAVLVAREMIDPPGFSPERGRPLYERDREQEISYATSAQFPTPVEPDRFNWKTGVGRHLLYAYEQNRRLVIVNKGPDESGFTICETCGAAWPESQGAASNLETHYRPFLIDRYIMQREGLQYKCFGPLHPQPLYLGYSFLTDLLLLRIALHPPLAYCPSDPWLHDALRSTAEALSLAASLQLDIDPGELSAGYRLMPIVPAEDAGALALVDVYLFDTASGGAGYAAEAGDLLPDILNKTISLLEGCPERCERSCTKCLRHYGNRYWHKQLDRHLATQLVKYARDGKTPSLPSVAEQAMQLAPLQRYLELEGWQSMQYASVQGIQVPLLVNTLPEEGKTQLKIAIGTYPALLDSTSEYFTHQLYSLNSQANVAVVLLNDYIVSRDLPTAYQYFRKGIRR